MLIDKCEGLSCALGLHIITGNNSSVKSCIRFEFAESAQELLLCDATLSAILDVLQSW